MGHFREIKDINKSYNFFWKLPLLFLVSYVILQSSLPGSQILKCHPELAAKFVETEPKRDFIPLPGVSGSYNSRTLSQFVKVGSCLIIVVFCPG